MESTYLLKCRGIVFKRAFRVLTCDYFRKQRICSGNPTNNLSSKTNFEANDVDPDLTRSVRCVPRTYEEFKNQKSMKPVQPENPRYLKVAIIGDPNAGKSTLTNQLTGWRACSVSSKVHTTRRISSTILNVNDTQLEFTDTPGTLTFEKCVKHNIESNLVQEPQRAVYYADVLLAIVDASNIYTRYELSPELKSLLEKHRNKQSVLVLNKIDSVRHRSALMKVAWGLCNEVIQGKPYGTEEKEELILPNDAALKKSLFKKMDQRMKPTSETRSKKLKGWSNFSQVFMVSAMDGEGVSSVLEYLLKLAPLRPWRYHPSVVVNDEPHVLAKRVLREKLLNTLKEEIGYKLNLYINSWEVNEADVLRIGMTIKCPKKNLVSMVIGPAGNHISELSKSVQQELSNVFHCDVQIHLAVKHEQPFNAAKQ